MAPGKLTKRSARSDVRPKCAKRWAAAAHVGPRGHEHGTSVDAATLCKRVGRQGDVPDEWLRAHHHQRRACRRVGKTALPLRQQQLNPRRPLLLCLATAIHAMKSGSLILKRT